MRTENTRKAIDRMTRRIVRRFRPEKIILFGSRAWGKPRRDSDIDLFIIKRTKDRHIDRSVAVRDILEDENQSFSFDLIVYTPAETRRRIRLGDDFIKKIVNEGIVLYG